MATFTKFQPMVENLAEKVFNLGTDTLKVMLSNTAPTNTFGTKSQITEISAGNGYTAGGQQATQVSSAQTGGTYKLVCSDVTFAASGGTMATFRYAILYDDTAANDELIGYWDYGTGVSLGDGESFVVDFNATNGVLQIS